MREAGRKPWVVYSKAPFAGPEHVLKYLARYTHRVAIANSRLASFEDGRVSFRYKDYARGSAQRMLSLGALEFLRRFLLHVLPGGFQRIRCAGTGSAVAPSAVRSTRWPSRPTPRPVFSLLRVDVASTLPRWNP